MAIGKGSRVALRGPGNVEMLGFVYRVSRGAAHVISDAGQLLKGDPRALRETDAPVPADHPSRRFRPGDRAEMDHRKDGRLVGTVLKSDRFGFVEFATDDGRHFTDVVAVLLTPSDKPAPDGVKPAAALVKGDRVEFRHGGETRYGVVTKSGARIQVTTDGGTEVISGPAALFRRSDKPLKVGPPDAMDRWSIVSYKEHRGMSQETTCFEAVIALDGKKAIFAENDGHGGSDFFRPMPGATRAVVDRFEKDAEAWAGRFDPQAGSSTWREHGSDWIHWSVNRKPFGVPAADFFEDRARENAAPTEPFRPL